jgi:hypothetical protein
MNGVRESEHKNLRAARARVPRLLNERMALARRVIRYSFRSRPDIVQRTTSQYRRERRVRQRKAHRAPCSSCWRPLANKSVVSSPPCDMLQAPRRRP